MFLLFLGVDGKSDTLILSKLFQMQWLCAPNKGVACRGSTRFASLPFLESLFTETSHVPAKNSDCFQGWTICRWYSSSRKIAGPEQPFPWHGMITKENSQHDQDRVTASICLNTEYPSTLLYQSVHHSPHFPFSLRRSNHEFLSRPFTLSRSCLSVYHVHIFAMALDGYQLP